MKKISQAIVVEGTYDKIKLSSIVDATIITSDGFDIFQNREKQEYIKKLAKECGIIVLTDSDRAGFMIRNFIKGFVKEGQLFQAFIPDVLGKEKRKKKPSKEGMLGVEGIDADIILSAIEKACPIEQSVKDYEKVTIVHFYRDGFSGGDESHKKRQLLAEKIGAPKRISAKELIRAINAFGGYEMYEELLEEMENDSL